SLSRTGSLLPQVEAQPQDVLAISRGFLTRDALPLDAPSLGVRRGSAQTSEEESRLSTARASRGFYLSPKVEAQPQASSRSHAAFSREMRFRSTRRPSVSDAAARRRARRRAG